MLFTFALASQYFDANRVHGPNTSIANTGRMCRSYAPSQKDKPPSVIAVTLAILFTYIFCLYLLSAGQVLFGIRVLQHVISIMKPGDGAKGASE